MSVEDNGLTLQGLAQRLETHAQRLESLERENERISSKSERMRSENAELRSKVATLEGSGIRRTRQSGELESESTGSAGQVSRRWLLSKAVYRLRRAGV